MIVSSVSDYLLSGSFPAGTGTLHSAFASSFNVEVSGRLVHVGTTGSPLSCIGMAVVPEEMARALRTVSVGDRVTLGGGSVRVYSRLGVTELSLAGASVLPLSVPALTAGSAAGAGVALARCLEAAGLSERVGLPRDARTGRALSALGRFAALCRAQRTRGLSCRDGVLMGVRGMCQAVAHLVGRGLGLTPSGDDVLAGFGVGLRCLCGPEGSWLAERYLDAVASFAPGRTTAVSEAYLRAMVDGYANEDYIDLLHALEGGETDALPARVNRVLSVGHTSGADGLLGFGVAFCWLS